MTPPRTPDEQAYLDAMTLRPADKRSVSMLACGCERVLWLVRCDPGGIPGLGWTRREATERAIDHALSFVRQGVLEVPAATE